MASHTEKETIDHFNETPWCKALITDPYWAPHRTRHQQARPRSKKYRKADAFFADTLSTDRTIRYCLTLKPREIKTTEPAYLEIRTIMDLGNGLTGHPSICHGGFVATMLDEVLGVLIQLNLEKKMEKLKREDRKHPGLSCFTAYLNTNYKRPVPAPGKVLCVAKFIMQERNKIYVSGSIEDGEGTVFTTGDGMFVEVVRTPSVL
ncbi:hypothetical protein M011DRAFT_401476 [Sporormia fimetaria CBS 119925]|uniref:Thioesterase domain-containing protein n=1 Tax=Sporormia fimetaria CBS 119925 TaxID=1340428 RepID=A0A6A6VCW6_9PLEO|nr:hypothetical protein M011DRAFT_401476 [Sporormia fimetaria CBS 119925]